MSLTAMVALLATPSCTLDQMGLHADGTGGAGGEGLACDEREDCPGVDTTCRIRSCTDGTCDFALYVGVACTENGGRFCDDDGNCVVCTDDAHCVAPDVCRQGRCISLECENGLLDGDESDVDCGGSCLPCGDGLQCNQGSDCQSGYCDPISGTCGPCSTHGDCPGQYCNVTDHGCRDKKIEGQGCADPEECSSGFCPGQDGVCCAEACDALCVACIEGKTGQTSGACVSVPANDDPDSECDDPSVGCTSNGDGCDGRADPACIPDAQGVSCGAAASCSGGTATLADTCNATGSCLSGGSEQCSPYFCDGGGVACETECSGHGDCVSDHWCDLSLVPDQCAADQNLGASCNGDDECIDNEDCEDDVCCDMQCDGACLNCDTTNPGRCQGNACSCQQQYDHTGYEGCTAATADQCKFYTAMSQSYSCGEFCRDRGGRCLGSYNNGADQCTNDEVLDCFAESHTTRICICTRGCNGNSRCPPDETCGGSGCS